MNSNTYNCKIIECKWQRLWKYKNFFILPKNIKILRKRKKYYILDMFPYPSATGLHAGHPRGYTATDVISRLKRQRGFNILHPMGWDSFGLPAERAAHREKKLPKFLTKRNINFFKRGHISQGYDDVDLDMVCD